MPSLVVAAVGCQSGADQCAQATLGKDPGRIAEACGQQFQRRRSVPAGLTALRARSQLGDLAGAEALVSALEGTEGEGEASVALAELYVKADPPDAGARLKARRERLAGRGQLVAAANVGRIEGRWAGWEKNRYLDALEAFDTSVGLAERAGDEALRRKALRGLFNMLYDLGDLPAARRCLAEASRGAVMDERTRTLLALDRGLLADAEDQPLLARAAFEEVLRAPSGQGHSEIAWNTTLNLLTLALRAGDLGAANRLFDQVERIFSAGGYQGRTYSRIARGRQVARLKMLREDPRGALGALTALSAEKPTPELSWELDLERGKALKSLGEHHQAIAAFEQAAKTIEGLRGDQADDFKSWVLARRREPLVQLFELHHERKDPVAALEVLERAQGRTFMDAFAATTVTGGGGRVGDAASRVQWLRRIYPALRTSRVSAAFARPVPELLTSLRDVRALAYLEADDALYLVAIRGDGPRIWRAEASLSQIRPLVARVLEDPGARGPLGDLSRALLPPEAWLPPPGAMLYLIPSPSLARVPFPALRQGNRFLIQRHTLAQVPSLNALAALRALPAAAGGGAVVMANASGDLPEAALEGASVARALGGPSAARLFLGSEATTANLASARGVAVLHFAVHSGVGANGPRLRLHDRALASADLLDHPLGAGLVVLASCASAATPDPGLWGSLAASFLASGTRAVVGSLWSTPDRASRQLVERFYAEGGAQAPARALARAQRAAIVEGRPIREWSGFAFFGAAESSSGTLAQADRR